MRIPASKSTSPANLLLLLAGVVLAFSNGGASVAASSHLRTAAGSAEEAVIDLDEATEEQLRQYRQLVGLPEDRSNGGGDNNRRDLRVVGGEVQSFEKRVEETLRNRGLFANGDKLDVVLDNVQINIGKANVLNLNNRYLGILARIREFSDVRNTDEDSQRTFSINTKDDFKRSFSAQVAMGIKWDKNNIEVTSDFTPNAQNPKDTVKFPVDRRAPFARERNLEVKYKFSGIDVAPRSKAESVAFFETMQYSSNFESRIKFTANGKLKARVKRLGKTTTFLLPLKEALGVNRSGSKGWKEGDNSDEAIFTAEGRVFWTDTDKVVLDVEQYSLDGDSKDVPYKRISLQDLDILKENENPLVRKRRKQRTKNASNTRNKKNNDPKRYGN